MTEHNAFKAEPQNTANPSLGLAAAAGLSTPQPTKLVTIRVHQCDLWAGNTRDVSLIDAARNDELKASIKANGQQVAVIGRRVSDSKRVQIVAGARRFAVLQELARDNPGITILIELRDIDDEAAYKLVAGENAGRSAFVPLETARFYRHALATMLYKDQAALAEALCLHKATVGRTLAILDLPPEMLGKVSDPRAISAAQACRFMTAWNDPTSQPLMQACLASLKPSNAGTTFKAVFAKVDPPEPKDELRTIGGAALGTLRSTKAGVKIELSNAADSIELDDLMASIRQRMLELRTRN